MKNLLLRVLSVIIIAVSAPMSANASSAAITKYSAFAKQHDKMPSEKIMAAAAKLENAGNEDKAIVLYTLVCNRFNKDLPEKEKLTCILAHVKAGILYMNRAEYSKAFDTEVEGVKLSEMCKEKKYNSQLYNVIGSIYTYYLDYEKAINYYKKALTFCKEYPDKITEYKILTNLTNMYTNKSDISEAKKYLEKAERLRDRKDATYAFMTEYTKGRIEMLEGKFSNQAERYKRLAVFAKKHKLPARFRCFAYQEIYLIYERLGNRDSLEKYLRICYEEAKRTDVLPAFISSIKDLADLYEKKGDIKTASQYRAIYISSRDSIQNVRKFDMAKNKLFLHEVEKTAKEIDALHEKELERARTIRNQWIALSIVLLFTLSIGIFLTIVNRQKKKLHSSYLNLFRQNRDNLNMQKQLEQLYKDTTAELEEKSSMIRKLQAELQEHDKTETKSATTDDAATKYHTSNLNEEGQKIIARKIVSVMEGTTEYCRTDFTLDRLAELVGSNSKYVSQVINDSFKKNFNAFINTYRIQLARERLIDVENYGNLTIKGIAESVGFKSPTTFINVFKKMVGLTPSMYQNMAKNEMKETEEQ